MASLTVIHVDAQDTETGSGTADDTSHQDIARQLQNPVADLISVPFQSNFEFDAGPNDGFKYIKLVKIPTNLQLGMKYYFSNPGLTPKWG